MQENLIEEKVVEGEVNKRDYELIFKGYVIGVEDILGREFMLLDYKVLYSDFFEREYAILQISIDNLKYTIHLYSTVILKQLKDIKEPLPIKRKIEQRTSKKGRKYYTLI